MARKSLSKISSSSENEPDSPVTNCHEGSKQHEESFPSHSSMEDEEPVVTLTRTPDTTRHGYSDTVNIQKVCRVLSGSMEILDNHPCLEQEITGLRSRIESLQMRELALNLQFEEYCEMKEQESLLMEINNMLALETARVEFLDREASSIEAETMRLENFAVQYLRIIEQLEFWKSEYGILQRKVQKLHRKTKAQSHLIKEQTLKIKEEQEEILKSHDALQTRISVINKLEDEIRELKMVLDQLQEEKNELQKKLDTAEEFPSKDQVHRKPLKYYLQIESEDYSLLLNELEQVKKERETEAEELINLRRINAFLRQELLGNHEKQQDQDRDHNMELEFEGNGGVMQYDSEHEFQCSFWENHKVSCIGSAHNDQASSKRRKLLKRLKRWVEGSEKVRVKPEEKGEIKCFGEHSVFYGSPKPEVSATARFCSSA
ncbi:uncharacterized protein LOC130721344 isoform X2 [Lotus japonicus]|nr:uncharacterized protein LOC130721344 isoform X2 [Lotus japonicus]